MSSWLISVPNLPIESALRKGRTPISKGESLDHKKLFIGTFILLTVLAVSASRTVIPLNDEYGNSTHSATVAYFIYAA